MNQNTITIKEYLLTKGITFRESGKELITKCLFNGCDEDSRPNEAHLYFNSDTGQYDCKKCGAKGNLLTLAKHLGDSEAVAPSKPAKRKQEPPVAVLGPEEVERYHQDLPSHIRQYLNQRGITDETISDRKIGFGSFHGKQCITIPIQAESGEYSFLKLRREPNDQSKGAKYLFHPTGSEAAIYNAEILGGGEEMVVICEGEFDCLILGQYGIPAISSTAGSMTFKDEWLDRLADLKRIYIAFDKDEAGEAGAQKLVDKINSKLPSIAIYKVTLPDRMTDGKDISDYFNHYDGNPDELIYDLSEQVAGPTRIDVSKFNPLTCDDLIKTLGLTIKQDNENKLATLLCELSAYTENAQFNISYNAPSSTGKSYIPTEIAKLFPAEDVLEIGYCSPTAFFHDVGEYDEEKKGYLVDLSRKILIFLDQPHTQLLERLRPLLSHDKKEISIKITDKSQKHGLRTKTVLLRGYPSVIFCTAGLHIDEQEATRFLLLSPEVTQDKIRAGIRQTVRKETDGQKYDDWLSSDPERSLLKERIAAIKQEGIRDIKISDQVDLQAKFLGRTKILKPRHQRDIKRLVALVKTLALLNLWWRERSGDTIIASEADVDEAFRIWDKISVSQELNLPPYIYKLYQEVILAAWNDKNQDRSEGFQEITGQLGVSRQEIQQKHYNVYGRMVDNVLLRLQILPMLETAGLITQEADPGDKRRVLVQPVIISDLAPP